MNMKWIETENPQIFEAGFWAGNSLTFPEGDWDDAVHKQMFLAGFQPGLRNRIVTVVDATSAQDEVLNAAKRAAEVWQSGSERV